MIDEGERIMYVGLGDHMAVLPVPKSAAKAIQGLRIDMKEPVYEMKKEALETAQRVLKKKLER